MEKKKVCRAWSKEDLSMLCQYLSENLSYIEIGIRLNRTASAVQAKTSRLGWAPDRGKDWAKEDIINLIRVHKSSTLFVTDPSLPNVKKCKSVLGVETWYECQKVANIEAKEKPRERYLYLISCIDIDNTNFCKIGLTYDSINTRFPGKSYSTLSLYKLETDKARKLEISIKEDKSLSINKYLPKDPAFYRGGHGGFSECFDIESADAVLEILLDNLLND